MGRADVGKDSYFGMVLNAFVDESERDDTHYFLGALVLDERQAETLRSDLDKVIVRHASAFPQLVGVELHGSTMMRAADKTWRSVPLRARFRIFEEVLDAVHCSGGHMYIEGIDIPALHRRYARPTPARELAFSHLFERINGCCDRDEPWVRIFADEHHTSEVSRSNFTRYKEHGTYGYRSSKLRHIHPDLTFISSHTDRALQAADVVTYLYNRLMTVPESNPLTIAKKEAMWKIVEPAASYPRGRTRIWP